MVVSSSLFKSRMFHVGRLGGIVFASMSIVREIEGSDGSLWLRFLPFCVNGHRVLLLALSNMSELREKGKEKES